MNEASYRDRAGAPTRTKSFWWTALALSLLLSAVLLGTRFDGVSTLPGKATRWFFGLDEADKFAIPMRRTGSDVDP